MTSVAEIKEVVAAAVREFAAFYRGNTSRIDALPNAADMHALRTDLLATIQRVSDDVERELATGSAASAALIDEASMTLDTLRSRRAEIEHYLSKNASGAGAMFFALGVTALGVALYAASGGGRSFRGLADSLKLLDGDCGCDR